VITDLYLNAELHVHSSEIAAVKQKRYRDLKTASWAIVENGARLPVKCQDLLEFHLDHEEAAPGGFIMINSFGTPVRATPAITAFLKANTPKGLTLTNRLRSWLRRQFRRESDIPF
jgi:hypothetical protein